MKTRTSIFALRLAATRGLGAAALLGALALSGPAGADTIIRVGDRTLNDVRVTTEKFAEVTYEGKRGKETIDGKRIADIIHDDAPRSYRAGDGQRKGGQYAKAVESYQKALEEGKKPWVKAWRRFQIAECLRLGGKPKEAIAAYKKCTSDTEHLLYPRALVGLGIAHGDAEEWADAVSTLKKVSDGRYGLWKARADYALGQVYIGKKSMTDARRAFARVQNQNDDPTMRQAGVVGEGETYLAEKNFSRAISFFERIISNRNLPPEVAAGAWAGIGDSELALSEERKDKAAEMRALLAYLQVVVQYSGTPGAYPKALYMAAKIYEKAGLKAQAATLRRELKSRAPSSSYAAKLKDS